MRQFSAAKITIPPVLRDMDTLRKAARSTEGRATLAEMAAVVDGYIGVQELNVRHCREVLTNLRAALGEVEA